MKVTNRHNDARRVYDALAVHKTLSRNYLLRTCKGSPHRLSQALAQLRSEGKVIWNVGPGQRAYELKNKE